MYVIDVNTSFGKRVDPDPRYSLDALCAELARHQVARALSYSVRGIHYEAPAANTESMAAGRSRAAILPVATLDPREGLGWPAEIDRCLRGGMRVFRFFPGLQKWSVDSILFRRILEHLRGKGVCLIVSTEEGQHGWEFPRRMAALTADLGLPLILTDARYGNLAEIIAVLREYPHVHAETNWLASIGSVEIMVRELGADRLLYGSGAPGRPMQKALNEVLEADISAADKAAILGGNAMRLLGLDAAGLAGAPQLASTEPARFAEEIIDVHSHLGYWPIPVRHEDNDPAMMLERMRRFGIAHSVLSNYESMRYDVAAGNRALAGAIQGHPELHGYMEVDPHRLDLSCHEMDRYYADPRFIGCELELTHIPCPTGSPKVHALIAEIARRGKPVLFMAASHGDAAAERALARENPSLKLIHAHGFNAEWARIVQDTPNICVEFCWSSPSHHNLRECLDILGPDRVLFGSDQTLLSVGAAVGLYLDAQLTPVERRKILSENARRLFGL